MGKVDFQPTTAMPQEMVGKAKGLASAADFLPEPPPVRRVIGLVAGFIEQIDEAKKRLGDGQAKEEEQARDFPLY